MNTDRLALCYHEAGHAAMYWWTGAAGGALEINAASTTACHIVRSFDFPSAPTVLRLVGGLVAEVEFYGWRSRDVYARRVLRDEGERRIHGSDTARLTRIFRMMSLPVALQRRLRLRLQIHCIQVLRKRRVWSAVATVARRLYELGRVEKEEVDLVFSVAGKMGGFFKERADQFPEFVPST